MGIPGPYKSKQVANLASGVQFWGKYLVAEKNQRKNQKRPEYYQPKAGRQLGPRLRW